MDLIYKIVNDHSKVLLRSEIISKKFKYFNLNNTTEYLGLKTLFYTCSQIYDPVEIYSQDILNSNFDMNADYDKNKYKNVEESLDSTLQSFLFEPTHRNTVIMLFNYF
jgi:hypothetical protein